MLDRSLAPASYPIDHFKLPSYEIAETGKGPLYIIRDHQLPVIQIELLFESGKSYQTVPGTSYYAIKMLPEGSKKYHSDEISTAFESLGSFVEFGSGIDHTYVKVYSQSTHIQQTLETLSEVMLNPVFPKDQFATIKQIRAQQIRQQNSKNSQLATASFNQQLFGKTHPLGYLISPDEALNSDLSNVIEYYQLSLFASPKAFITGDISDQVVQQIRHLIDELPTHTAAYHNHPPATQYETIRKNRENSEQVSYRIGMFTLDKKNPDFHYLNIANTLLGGYFGSRLMKTIREELGYTYGIYSTFVHTLHHSYWMISSELVKKHAEHGVEAIQQELKKLAIHSPENKELATLKNYLKGKMLSSVDSIFSQGNLIKGLKLFDLPDDYYDGYFNAIDNITPNTINQMVAEYLIKPNKTSLLLG